jgi:hypothetical protein
MMQENLDPQAGPTKEEQAARDADEQATDREVPLAAAATPAIIHAWLDGERVDDVTLRAAGGYELWSRVNAETDRRRRMRTPTPIAGAIMEAVRKEG